MARRNPTNQRYTTDKPAGKTRKSAAAAKPKRSVGAGSSSSGSKGASAAKKPAETFVMHPPIPEYKRLRRIWWVFIGIAVALATVSWLIWQSNQTVGLGIMLVGYVFMGIALWLDFTKMRPLRTEYAKSGKSAKSETAKSETAKSETAKSEAAKPAKGETAEAAESEAAKPAKGETAEAAESTSDNSDNQS